MQTWHIQTRCPQCGAPVSLTETQRVLHCEYCKTRLYLLPKGFQCYLLPPKKHKDEILFIPFWRIKGMSFVCKMPSKIEAKVIDKTTIALDFPLGFTSLGIRPQAINLEFADVKRGIFLSPQLSFKEALQKIKTRSKSNAFRLSHSKMSCNYKQNILAILGNEEHPSVTVIFHSFIGEVWSLIYFPIFIEESRQKIILKDGLSRQNIGDLTLKEWEQFKKKKVSRLPAWQFLPLICPHCGWDIPCDKEAWAVFCPNCNRGWGVLKNKFVPLHYKVAKTEGKDIFYLPFWQIRATASALSLHTYADLIRFANLSKVIKSKHRKIPFYFYIPAFKLNPHQFLNIAKTLTLNQPDYVYFSQPVPNAHPVILPPTEALEAIKLVMADIAVPKRYFFPRLKEIEPKVTQIILLFLPFVKKGIELILANKDINLAIPVNALKWGSFL